MMLLALGLFLLSNLISMLTSDFTVLLAARVMPAFLHPVYVSMALTVAASTGGKGKAPQAVAKVFAGVSAGMVLGVPATSYIASEVSYAMAMFGFFSYLSDYLKKVTDVSYTIIIILLLLYGIANILGNMLAGKLLSANGRLA